MSRREQKICISIINLIIRATNKGTLYTVGILELLFHFLMLGDHKGAWLQVLDGSPDGGVHVAASVHAVVDGLPIHNLQQQQQQRYLLDLLGDSAQDECHYAHYVVPVYLIDLPLLVQPVVVVYVHADAILYVLQLLEHQHRLLFFSQCGHLKDRYKVVALDLQLGINTKILRLDDS